MNVWMSFKLKSAFLAELERKKNEVLMYVWVNEWMRVRERGWSSM